MITWATTMTGKVHALLLLMLGVAIVWGIIKTYHATHALVPTALVGLTGGAAMWFATSYLTVSDKVGTDMNPGAAGLRPVVVGVARYVLAVKGLRR